MEPLKEQLLTAAQAQSLLSQGKGRSGMRVAGELGFHEETAQLKLPANLDVEVLDLQRCEGIAKLPRGLRCYELRLGSTTISSLPPDLNVEAILDLSNCEELTKLPADLKVGSLVLRGCTSLEALPEGLDVWFLNLTGCWSFQRWPGRATIRSGRLDVRGCTALASLPDYLGPLAALNIRDCPNLRDLPEGLKITGWIDIAQSGIAETKRLPRSLQGVELRWQGVRVEERIVLRPETISVHEVLAEQNAERRRVLLDRFGYPRFMKETKAALLDEDRDAGGIRQLLRVDMKDDEPLVTLSCFCPSTGRQYFLRVPPKMNSCHQSAAWIAGFDDPELYRPSIET